MYLLFIKRDILFILSYTLDEKQLHGCCSSRIWKLHDAILLHVKAGTGTDGTFTSSVPSPLDEERRSMEAIFFAFPQTNENKLNHGQNLKLKSILVMVMSSL